MEEVQYFDVGAPPVAPQPWWKERRNQRSIAIALAVVMVVFVVGLLAWNMYRGSAAVQRAERIRAAQQSAQQQAAASCDEGDTACAERIMASAAAAVGEPSACESLSEEQKTQCVIAIAAEKGDPQSCNTLAGESKERCEDSAYLHQAIANDNVGTCAKIKGEGRRVGCESRLRTSTSVTLDDAIEAMDVSACAALSLEEQGRCLDTYTSRDQDGDGLTDAEELEQHKTDPRSADTDGDGYDDGTEIEGGYNPLQP